MSIITFQDVHKSFGDTKAVNGVSFHIPEGCIYGLLGPNGAGKTTSIRIITNILLQDSGAVSVNGLSPSPATQRTIGYLPEERGLYKKMKIGEQLIYLAQLKGLSKQQAEKSMDYWLKRFDALDWKQKELGELSKGMSQKIQFIATIIHDPEIYIFDEPFSGLDPINSETLKEVVLELRDKEKTILLATHRMEKIEQMCDDICLFNRGKKVLDGNLRQIKQSFGKNTILMEFEGNPAFLNQLGDVRINNRSNNFAEIRMLDGQSPQDILTEAINHVNIHKFESVEPSLQEIFISTVGEDNINHKELA
jgi:ABC-2 type transport system ATP-binding protein